MTFKHQQKCTGNSGSKPTQRHLEVGLARRLRRCNLISDGLRVFEYDSQNRHSKTIVNDPDEGSKITYLHNALGQRVFKSEPKVDHVAPNATALGTPFIDWLKINFGWLFAQAQLDATLGQAYVYDDGQLGSTPTLLGEYGNGGSNSLGRYEYIWLPTESGQPMPIGQHRTTIISATHADHLGTPRKITGTDNNTAWQLPYSAFGENAPTGTLTATSNAELAFATDAATATKLATSNPLLTYNLRFPGQYFDSESRLYYNYFRSYQPTQGRYSQSDPIGLAGGLNRFSYAESNPLSFTDPDGLRKKSPPIPGDFGKQPYVADYWRNDTTRRFRDGYYASVCVRTSCEFDSAAGMCTIDDLRGTGKFRTAGPFLSVAGQKTSGCECTKWAFDWREGIRPPAGALDKMNLLLHTFGGGGYQ